MNARPPAGRGTGIFLLVLAVVVFAGATWIGIYELRFAIDGREITATVDGRVRSSRGGPEIAYHFFAPNDGKVDGRGPVDPEQWSNVNAGDQIRVLYVASDPKSTQLPNADRPLGVIAIYAGSLILVLGGAYFVKKNSPQYARPIERPELMDDETLQFGRLLERFAKPSEIAGHLHHRGKVREVNDEKGRSYELECDCGVTLGPWRDR